MRVKWSLGIAMGWALLASMSFAQTANQGTSTVYRIRALDIIRVQVYNEQQINMSIRVLEDGRASLPFAGTIEVAGKTTAEVESELVAIYKERLSLKNPIVSVMIEVFRPIQASVTGAFFALGGNPQAFEFRPGDKILTLVTRAGGPRIERSDLRRAMLIRNSLGGREIIPVDLHALLVRGDLSQNYELQDGDTLNLPDLGPRFYNVQGAVNAPGQYEYREPTYLYDAISVSRGPQPNRAKMSEIIIMRPKPGKANEFTYYKVNYVRLIKNRDQTQNMELKPGDLVYVTETKTPDLNQLGQIFNSVFVVQRLLTDGIFGFRLFN